jgi:predicted AlkP superfamily pyrophosphatase or phosphodiesterase
VYTALVMSYRGYLVVVRQRSPVRRVRRRRLLIVVALLGALAGCAVHAQGPGRARHIVIISIDGMRPEFYLDDAWAAPELRALLKAGSHAWAAEGVFPTITYPNHATIVTGVRPARHGVLSNTIPTPAGTRGHWYEEMTDFRASPIWDWARAAGLTTAAVSWPVTAGARIDLLVPERDYYAQKEPLERLRADSSPGIFERLGVTPKAEMFKDVVLWDAFLTELVTAIIRQARPNLVLVHLVQTDYFQHRVGREGAEPKAAVARVDAHVGTIRRTLAQAGLADRSVIIVTGDHGFEDARRGVHPNVLLARAGLRGCPEPGDGWRAIAYIAGGSAAILVNPPGDAAAATTAEKALRADAGDAYTIVSRAELDALGALPNAAFAIAAAPGFAMGSGCRGSALVSASGGQHGYLPSHPRMPTGFIAAGAGVRTGVALERVRLVDIAPTAAWLLGLAAPDVEGRVLGEILE